MKINPCPNCGWEAVEVKKYLHCQYPDLFFYGLVCNNYWSCSVTTIGASSSLEMAIENWNKLEATHTLRISEERK